MGDVEKKIEDFLTLKQKESEKVGKDTCDFTLSSGVLIEVKKKE